MYSTRWLIGVSGLTHLDDLVAVQCARLRVCFIQDSIEYVLYKVVHRGKWTHSP